MANDYFQDDGNPGYKGSLASGAIRTLFANIEAGFDKLVGLTGNGSKIVAINSAGTAQEALSTTGSGNVVRATSPTLVTPALGTPASGVLDNCSLSSAKTTPIDADSVVIVDSEASSVLKKLTWANLKAALGAGMTFTGPVLFDTVADIASAATIDLTAYGSGFIAAVTGTTPTSTILMEEGQFCILVPAAAWPLTYSATTCRVSTLADFQCKASQPIRVYKKGGVVFAAPEAHIAQSVSATSGVSTSTDFATYTADIQVKINGTSYNKCWSSRAIGGDVGNMQSSHSVEVTGSSCEIAAFISDTTTALQTTLTFPEYGTYMVSATASCSTYSTNYSNWVSGHAIRVR